jgi:hypothetical protein
MDNEGKRTGKNGRQQSAVRTSHEPHGLLRATARTVVCGYGSAMTRGDRAREENGGARAQRPTPTAASTCSQGGSGANGPSPIFDDEEGNHDNKGRRQQHLPPPLRATARRVDMGSWCDAMGNHCDSMRRVAITTRRGGYHDMMKGLP